MPRTMDKELELAINHYKNGHLGEAEYHLRRLLHNLLHLLFPYDSECLLYTARPGESVELLFSSLSDFIVEFPLRSTEGNSINFDAINYLFAQLALFGALGVEWG